MSFEIVDSRVSACIAGFAASVLLFGCATTPLEQAPLGPPGDAVRGREVFVSREGGHCVLCHRVPGLAVAGDVGPALDGIGARLSPGEIRYRVADITRLNPEAAMPAFHRTEGLERVAPAYAGRPVLDARQVEDLVAYLGSLR
ncbi:MAG: sulfur oxidation c-type cytochrome SoxX [Betaproteobacteria bacterium]|nr:sulfur oxidation c-type cytochrome SoxX [Betaproteobacteria bacterium]